MAMQKKRGRPKALSMGRATHKSQRELDDLLVDIARTRQKIKSVRELVTVLKWQPKYENIPDETLRTHVTEVMHWAASRLHRLKLFSDDLKHGVPFDEAVAAAQARPLKLDRDQFLKTLQVVRERVRELLTQKRYC
jgi:hypothetical protein